ncbi:transport protein RbsD/fucU [Nitzschia inconspicua]|uniref:Transport protein RbsD/fucU n=1 Tax=Nitzschia inconspicua TaxID=303405 RepID=A0A9K3KXB0_9STRA|nr:transport protein RbsD/fucU [Nitzschia inconspicua]
MGLLKGIDPLLTADLLWILRSMGHGDKICICDCNFPAYQVSTQTTSQKLVPLSVSLPVAVDAIVGVLPLDHFVQKPARIMAPSPGMALPSEAVQVKAETQTSITKHAPTIVLSTLDRFDFYDEARTCFAIVQTSERRPYGNIILQKGVIGPDGTDLMPSSL